MAETAEKQSGHRPKGRKRRWLRNGVGALLLVLAIAALGLWWQREQLADTLIADTFAENGIRATYAIDSIGPQEQVLSDIVIGDPARPDVTIERLVLEITPRFGLPDLTQIRVVRPRVFASYRDGTFSLGELDPLIFGGEDGPVEFPDTTVIIEDGRGLLESDFGRVGLKMAGGGHLRGGFQLELAGVAEELTLPGCAVERPTLYGELSIDAERPRFSGPLRFAALDCAAQGLTMADGAIQIAAQAERNLVDFEGSYALSLGLADHATVQLAGLTGEGQFAWRDGNLNALYEVNLSGVSSPYANAADVAVEGRLRALENFARINVEGDVAGAGLALGSDVGAQLANAATASEGTLAAPLLEKFSTNLSRAMRGAALSASFDARQTGSVTSVVVPEARMRGGDGATLLALSRARLTSNGQGLPRFSGNIATSGAGLPQISGRMELGSTGALELRATMREYSAGNARLSVPQLAILQGRDGALAIEGLALASGPLPGGEAQELNVPIDARVGADGAIALWDGCRQIGFDQLAVSNLTLERQSLSLCPPSGRPILEYGENGFRLAAGVSALDLTGELAGTPMQLRSDAIGFAWPGVLSADNLDVTLGAEYNSQRFTITDLRADLSEDRIAGEFADADVIFGTIPLDILGAQGSWQYQDDILTLNDISFVLEDREPTDRFVPLVAQGASMTLADNQISANAILRHPATGTAITDVQLSHDLSDSSGSADLIINRLTFRDGFQPLDISPLAYGVVADVAGSVVGSGRIEWDVSTIISRGRMSSDGLDLAAAFGPVKGASGTVEFTDLLALTTAPDQRIQLEAINPGIEIYNGVVGFQLSNRDRLRVTGGQWPFMGGTLTMRPVNINIGVAESRTYIMDIDGLQASQFVEQMEMGNLAASGTFDGTIPIVFDAIGEGQLVGGFLRSREPGGNLSYVGELTYEDMGYFANYAFRTLRDMQFRSMELDMNGPLTGELVTQVRFDGISQGATAERNFVSRVIADLPIELRINIRAPFYQLMTSLRAIYDPAALRDPRSLGLMTDDGERLRQAIDQQSVNAMDARAAEQAEREFLESLTNDEPGVQPPDIQTDESEAEL